MAENKPMPDKFNELPISSKYEVGDYELHTFHLDEPQQEEVGDYELHTFHLDEPQQEESKDEIVDIKTTVMDHVLQNDYNTVISKISEFIHARSVDESLAPVLGVIDAIVQVCQDKFESINTNELLSSEEKRSKLIEESLKPIFYTIKAITQAYISKGLNINKVSLWVTLDIMQLKSVKKNRKFVFQIVYGTILTYISNKKTDVIKPLVSEFIRNNPEFTILTYTLNKKTDVIQSLVLEFIRNNPEFTITITRAVVKAFISKKKINDIQSLISYLVQNNPNRTSDIIQGIFNALRRNIQDIQPIISYLVQNNPNRTSDIVQGATSALKGNVDGIQSMILYLIQNNSYKANDIVQGAISALKGNVDGIHIIQGIFNALGRNIQGIQPMILYLVQNNPKNINDIVQRAVNIIISSGNSGKIGSVISDVIKDEFFDIQVDGKFINKNLVNQIVGVVIETYSSKCGREKVDPLIVDLVQGAPMRVTRITTLAIWYHRQYSEDINKIKPLILEILKLDCAKTDTFCVLNVIRQIVSEYFSEKTNLDKISQLISEVMLFDHLKENQELIGAVVDSIFLVRYGCTSWITYDGAYPTKDIPVESIISKTIQSESIKNDLDLVFKIIIEVVKYFAASKKFDNIKLVISEFVQNNPDSIPSIIELAAKFFDDSRESITDKSLFPGIALTLAIVEVAVGSLISRKGIDSVEPLISKLIQQNPQFTFVIVEAVVKSLVLERCFIVTKSMIISQLVQTNPERVSDIIQGMVNALVLSNNLNQVGPIILQLIQNYQNYQNFISDIIRAAINTPALNNNSDGVVLIISDIIKSDNKQLVTKIVSAVINDYVLKGKDIENISRLVVDFVQEAPARITQIVGSTVKECLCYGKKIDEIKPLIFNVLGLNWIKHNAYHIANVIYQTVDMYFLVRKNRVDINEIGLLISDTISLDSIKENQELISAVIKPTIMICGTPPKGRISDIELLISRVINSEPMKSNPDTISKIIVGANAACASGKYNDVLKSNGEGVALIGKLNDLNSIAHKYILGRIDEEAFLKQIRLFLVGPEIDSKLSVSPQLSHNK